MLMVSSSPNVYVSISKGGRYSVVSPKQAMGDTIECWDQSPVLSL